MTPLEIEYSPSSCIDDLDHELSRYRELSDAAAARVHRVKAFGPNADEFCIVFRPDHQPGPLHVFIHGGYWQQLSAWDSLMAAPVLLDAGVSFAAVNYSLAPDASIETMIEQCCAAVVSLIDDLAPTHVTLSGSSAGAHLAARTALRLPSTVHRLILLSGIYDLRPLVHTYVNDPLGLDERRAAELSIDTGSRPVDAVVIAHGDNETEAFKRQSGRLAAVWGVPACEVGGRNHFDLVLDLAPIHLGEIVGVPRQESRHESLRDDGPGSASSP